MSATWNPTSPEDIETKKAFDGLGQSLDNVVIASSESAKSNRFILHSKGYFDLQAYVMSGKDFPTTYDAFDAKFPKSAFKKLNELDSNIYDKTRETMVAVGSNCLDYHHNHLSELISAGDIAIAYSDNALETLDTPDDNNLRHNLDILMDEKYTSTIKFDQAFTVAKEAALMDLHMLSDEAKEKQKETAKIMQTLIRFKEDTLKNQPNVKFLIKQYKTGPVENDSDMKTPYLKYLNKDLDESLTRFNKLLRDAKTEHINWETSTGFAVGLCFFGIIGWIAMTPLAIDAAGCREAYDKLAEQIKSLRQEREDETNLVECVNMFVVQCADIDLKMNEAITAMTELSQLFSTQSNCYDRIAYSIKTMEEGAVAGALANRRSYIRRGMNGCVSKLKELKVVAQEFTKSVHTQITL